MWNDDAFSLIDIITILMEFIPYKYLKIHRGLKIQDFVLGIKSYATFSLVSQSKSYKTLTVQYICLFVNYFLI